MMRNGVLGLLVMILLHGLTFAQSKTSANLSGTVTDPTDAVIPGAKVTVTSAETGITRQCLTDERGEYRFLLLPPGLYEIKVEITGFGGQTRKGVEVTVGQTAVEDFKLSLDTGAQLVLEVQAKAPVIETDRTQQSNTITQESVRNLPINRRDYLSYALLAPGVSDSKALADSNSFRVKQTPDSGLSFYGSNGRGNNISVDGGESNDAGGGVRPTVSQEAVQEFQINRTNYSAEHGTARGGVINIVTRSGSNNVRGTLFGFFRHQSLDAGDPFAIKLFPDNRLARVKPDSNRQQFGGTIGGPIVRDRTFFILSYERLRRRESATVPVLTDLSIFQPTAAQEAILRTLAPDQAGTLRALLTSPQRTVDMFRINSGVFPFQTDQHQGLLRLDHSLNDNNQLGFRYNVTTYFDTNQNLAALVGYSRGYVQDALDSNALATWTHVFSPKLVNEARAQFNYYNIFTGSNDLYGPALEIAGFGFFNRDRFLPNDTFTRREELVENLTWSKGAHTLRMGAYALIRQNHSSSATFFSGRFTFGPLPGALLSPALAGTTINALQAFNLGLAQSYQQGFGDPVVRAIYPLYAGFIQDTWKPRPNLTLNYGVRYELDHRKDPVHTDGNNFAPRFGFAWDPFNDRKTTIRGGYGLFYAQIDYQIDYVANALNEINGYRQIAQVLTTGVNPATINGPVNIFRTLRDQGIIGIPTPQRPILATDLAQFGILVSQTGPRPPLTVLFHTSPDYQNPSAQQGSFGIEREVSAGFSVGASYIFARGTHLTTSRDDNLLPAPVNPAKGIQDWGVIPSNPADNPTGTKYFKQPLLFQDNVYESTANSFYHGLILDANKRFGRRFSFSGNYTFSKAIDETTDYNSDFQPNNQLCRRCERALSSFDQRRKVVLYALVQAPRGGSGYRKLFGDFTLTPIYRYNSSRPFNLLAGAELNNDRHNTTDRPYFAGRNIGSGPTFWTFDARLTRSIRVREHRTLELMFEAFNLFNNLNLASVNNTVGSAIPSSLHGLHERTPSQPLGFTAAFDPRRIQLGMRLSF